MWRLQARREKVGGSKGFWRADSEPSSIGRQRGGVRMRKRDRAEDSGEQEGSPCVQVHCWVVLGG